VLKIAFVGAGSAVFARQLITDILAVDGLDEGVIALVDIDAARLELARQIAERLVELSGKRWSVTASTERADVLAGSHYVINSIEVAGLEHVRADYEIPMRYGVDQCCSMRCGKRKAKA
jgi:alpha-galactosidase